MKKYIFITLIFLLMGQYITAQEGPTGAPTVATWIDRLIQSIENNTAQTQETYKRMEDMTGSFTQTVDDIRGRLILEVCFWMTMLYLCIAFIDRIRKGRKQKTYEQKIAEEERRNLKQLKVFDEMLEKLNKNLSWAALHAEKLNELNPENKLKIEEYQLKGFINGICIGAIITVIIHMLGVF
jgi:hypothetical protein